MDSPYLESGESIVLTTDRISINSHQYDVLLTTRYLILVDIRYDLFEPQKIPLVEIHSVKGGTITTGDLVITLFFFDAGRTGSTQMNLIFSRQPDEQRDRERDEWLRRFMELIVSVRREVAGTTPSAATPEIGIRPAKRRAVAPEMQPPHTTVINTRPEPVELTVTHDEGKVPSFPENTEPEAGYGEKPVEEETGSEPEETIPVVIPAAVPEITPPPVPPEVPESTGIPDSLSLQKEETGSEPEETIPVVIPAAVPEITPPPVPPEVPESTGIPDSLSLQKEETGSEPEETIPVVIPAAVPEITPPPVPPEVPESTGIPDSFSLQKEETGSEPEETIPVVIPAAVPEITPPPVPPEVPESTGTPDSLSPQEGEPGSAQETASPALPKPPESLIAESPDVRAGETESPEEISPEERGTMGTVIQTVDDIQKNAPGSPPVAPGPGSQRIPILVAAIIILILGAAGGAVLFSNYLSAPGKELSSSPTPGVPEIMPSTPAVLLNPVPSQVLIPATGVWVRVVYPRSYYGRLGNPGSLRGVNGSGDQFYQVNEDDRLVQAQIYKRDNTGEQLFVGIYRNGTLITQRLTSSPMGSIELLIDASTGNAPGITPGITPSAGQPANRTANQTSLAGNRTITVTSTPVRPVVNQSVTNTSNRTGSGGRVLYF